MKKAVMVGMLVLGLAGLVSAMTIDVGSTDYTYGHNYNGGGDPRNFWYDSYDYSGGFFGDNKWYLNGGTTGYQIYKFQAAPGSTISDIALQVKTYLERGSWLSVYYRTTDYTGSPNFADWTNLGYSFVYGEYWTTSFQPRGNVVYLAYQGGNNGTQAYQFQLQADQVDMTIVPEPAVLSMLGLGILGIARRRK